MKTVTKQVAKNLIDLVDEGLPAGLGIPKPGQMCIEAVVCHVLGLPHGDNPEECVIKSAIKVKIGLNDSERWLDAKARGQGLKRAGLAQLGSQGVVDEQKFVKVLSEKIIRVVLPMAFRLVAELPQLSNHKNNLLRAAQTCEDEGTPEAANAAAHAATRAADTANAAANAAAHAAARAATYAAAHAAARAAARAATYAAAHAAARAADTANAAARAATYAAAHAAARAADTAHAAARAAANAAAHAAARAATYAADGKATGNYILSVAAELVVEALVECGSPGAKWLDMAPLELPPCPKGIATYTSK